MKTKTVKQANTIIHEHNGNAQHRIIIVRSGIPTSSPWFEHHQIAQFKGLLASYDTVDGLPVGVFKVSAVAHENL